MNTQMTTWRRWRLGSMLLFLTSSAFIGFLDYLLHDSESWMRVSWVIDLLIATAAIATWCHFDARILDYRISRRLRVWIVLASLIAVPIYIVDSRGWRGAWKLGLGLPFFAVSIWSHDLGWSLASYIIRPVSPVTTAARNEPVDAHDAHRPPFASPGTRLNPTDRSKHEPSS